MDVKKIAGLANLPVSEEELTTYEGQLAKIIDYVDQLQKTDTSKVPETSQVTGLRNVGREDKVIEHPKLVDGYFRVKAIFNND